MISKLKSVCLMIRLGYTFRNRFESDPTGNLLVVQMRDIDSHNRIDGAMLERWQMDDPKSSLLLQEGDVLFQSRGFSNTAALVPKELENAMASAPLMVIRPDPHQLLPGYLWWFLNHPQTQTRFLQGTTGALVRLVNKPLLENLEILLPSLDRQEKIAAMAQLAAREQKILETLQVKRRIFLEEVLMRAAQ